MIEKARAYIAHHGGFDAALAHARESEPDSEITATLTKWDAHRKACDYCDAPTQFSELRDITTCGDWFTICTRCYDRVRQKAA